jgi:competence protein ComEC
MPAVLIAPRPPAEAEYRLTLLDVGQGLAAVVRTLDRVLVFDTGARFGPDFDAGEAVLVPYLRHFGIRAVDMLVLSHGDNDHIGGAATLASALPVERVLTSVVDKITWTPAEPCTAGSSWTWNGVAFTFLHPGAASGFRGNDASCVLQVDNGNGRVLLTGDIQARAEAALVRDLAGQLSAHVIVAPHHGSKTSSTPAFVAAVHPDYVLFPSGYRNRWGFPHPEVVERYRALGTRRYNSADHGAITYEIPAAGGIRDPETYRQRRHRYWHDS